MDDLDFLNALRDNQRSTKKEAQAYFIKEAVSPEQMASDFIRQHAQQIKGALIGGGLATAAQYLHNRGKNGKPSQQQRMTQGLLDAAQRSVDESKAEGKPTSFAQDTALATTKGFRDIADVSAKHPGKSALMYGLPLGISAGWRIAKALS